MYKVHSKVIYSTYNPVNDDTNRYPSDERENDDGSYNVVFQKLSKFTGVSKSIVKILKTSDKILSCLFTFSLKTSKVQMHAWRVLKSAATATHCQWSLGKKPGSIANMKPCVQNYKLSIARGGLNQLVAKLCMTYQNSLQVSTKL